MVGPPNPRRERRPRKRRRAPPGLPEDVLVVPLQLEVAVGLLETEALHQKNNLHKDVLVVQHRLEVVVGLLETEVLH